MLVAEGSSYVSLTPVTARLRSSIFNAHIRFYLQFRHYRAGDIAIRMSLEIFSLPSGVESETGDLAAHTLAFGTHGRSARRSFTYSVGIDVAGRIIEVVSGKAFGRIRRTLPSRL